MYCIVMYIYKQQRCRLNQLFPRSQILIIVPWGGTRGVGVGAERKEYLVVVLPRNKK